MSNWRRRPSPREGGATRIGAVIADLSAPCKLFPQPPRHALFDNTQGVFTGTLFVSLAPIIFNQSGLRTGGTAGLALVLHCATGVRFGKLFVLVNLPCHGFA